MTPPRCRTGSARAQLRPRWLVLCTLVMALLLPLQGIALSLDAALRPAHVHRHAAGCIHDSLAMLPSAGAVQMVGDRSGIVAANSALADDAVLDYLPPRGDAHAHDVDGHAVGVDLTAGAVIDSHSSVSAHERVGHHAHAADDADVIYVGDGRDGADGVAGGLGRIASDGMVMLQPTWPQSLPARDLRLVPPAPLLAHATRHDVPPDRPPA